VELAFERGAFGRAFRAELEASSLASLRRRLVSDLEPEEVDVGLWEDGADRSAGPSWKRKGS